MKQIIKWFTYNHVAGNLLLLAMLILGAVTWLTLKKEIFPETSLDRVMVRIAYPNANPDDVEKGVCIPVEEAIADLNGIEEMTSIATESMGSISIEAQTGYPLRTLMDDIKTRVSALNTLPQSAEKPIIEELVLEKQVLSIALCAQTDEDSLRKIAQNIKDELQIYSPPPASDLNTRLSRLFRGHTPITRIDIGGLRDREISIEVPEQTLKRYGLSLAQIASAIRQSALDLPGGSVRTQGGEIKFKALARKYSPEEFDSIILAKNPDGGLVRLSDIARIKDSFQENGLTTEFNGKPALLINVFCTGNQDTLDIAQTVRSYLEEYPRTHSPSIELSIWGDQSEILSKRIDLLLKNGFTGFLFVALILALFLRPAIAFFVALGIPVAFCATLALMPWMGVTINMISLFGFILVLGIVVDDAVVIGENVYTRIQKGEPPATAAWRGTYEVSSVVTFGVLTTVVAFVPMLFMSGVSGKIWPNVSLIVISCLLFSLVQSFFVLPSHLSFLKALPKKSQVGPISRFQRHISEGLEWAIDHLYRPLLGLSLRWRYVTLSLFVFILLLTLGLIAGSWVKIVPFPEVEGDTITVQIEMNRGAAFSSTQKAVHQVTQAAQSLNNDFKDNNGQALVKNILSAAGSSPYSMGPNQNSSAEHLGQVTLELASGSQRNITVEELIAVLRERTGKIAGVATLSFEKMNASGAKYPIAVNLLGKDKEVLEKAVAFVSDTLNTYTGAKDIAHSNRAGKEEVQFLALTPVGESLGLSLQEVISQVRAAYYGDEVHRLQRDRDEVKVMVRYPTEERESLESLSKMRIKTPAGGQVPLDIVVKTRFARSDDTISRIDRMRSIKVTSDVDKQSGTTADALTKQLEKEALSVLDKKFKGISYAYDGEQKDQSRSMRELSLGLLAALLVNFILMAIPLRSYTQPLIVMSVIPFCIVGAIGAHLLLGMSLSIISGCGIVALAGMVVNSSLILVDYMNLAQKKHECVQMAAMESGVARFRPIFLTTATTLVGLLPIIAEPDMQAKFIAPMAVSLAGGLLFATIITLFLIPVLYLIMEDIKQGTRRLYTRLFSR